MKKVLSYLLVVTMLFTISPVVSRAQDEVKIEDDILVEQFGKEAAENMSVSVDQVDSNNMVVKSEYDSQNLNAVAYINIDSLDGTISVEGRVQEGNVVEESSYDVHLYTIEENDFNAVFINKETGEIYEMDTIKASASIWPYILAIIARVGLSAAQKQFGKTAVKAALKNLPKSVKKIDDSFLKKNGIDAHELKQDYLGKKAKISQYDLYIDKDTKRVWIYKKGGKGTPIPTEEFIK
ncbi:SAR2788 family putative toxin [Rossellomorea sp. NRS-1567]|uniref:SAR2788 family putative toxin n=1 Tax=Rossellomorea sp. NRS-1567 TaxID=3233901 RepID=UPI003D274513